VKRRSRLYYTYVDKYYT